MRIFIYARKSVFSDKSDSVDNQLRMCREYCDAHFPDAERTYFEYSDEDFSGKNTDRSRRAPGGSWTKNPTAA